MDILFFLTGCLGLAETIDLGGGTGDRVLAAVVLVTLFAHVYVFKSRNFRV